MSQKKYTVGRAKAESSTLKSNLNAVSRSSLTPKEEIKMAKLVGQKCTLKCFLDDVKTEVLWDTGAEVALISNAWLQQNFPSKEIKSVSELLGHELFLRVANNTKLDYLGYVELVFKMSESVVPLMVPFLVTEEEVTIPLVGYNVIEEVVKVVDDESSIVNMIETSLNDCDLKKAKILVNMIQKKVNSVENECLGSVKIGTKDVVIPKGRSVKLKCISHCGPVSTDVPVIFQPEMNLELQHDLVIGDGVMSLKKGQTSRFVIPVSNTGCKDVTLKAKTRLGEVLQISSVIPCPIEVNQVSSKEEDSEANEVKLDEDVNSWDEDIEGSDKDEEWMEKIDLAHLSTNEQKQVRAMLKRVAGVFSRNKDDIGAIDDLKMKINLKDDEPVKASYTSIPKPLYKEVQEYVEDLLANGWVQKSHSSYSSPMVCVRKKDGKLRLCIDYRKLNLKTFPDSQPIPKVQDILNSLGGNRLFTTIDMSKAYHQGFIHEDYRHLTAFATPWSLLEWIRIPFGLMNAPPVFQRYMNECLVGLRDVICIPYLDDILTYSKNFESHLKHVEMVLRRLLEHGIKINADKCKWFKKDVNYLGHIVSEDGYQIDGASEQTIDKLKVAPATVGELRSLLGFIGYYRSFIQDFSRKAKPLYDLLCKEKDVGKVIKNGNKKKGLQRSPNDKIVWKSEYRGIVDELLEHLKNPPVMAYPDFEKPFVLHCDASETGLGAVLYQEQDEKLRVIKYASRTLTPAEKNYYLHSGKLEFLAMKWAITDKFHDFLYYSSFFTVYSDCNPLTYVMSSSKLNATTMRWVGELANYHFNIKYRPGKQSVDCDYLSRIPVEENLKDYNEEIASDTIGAVVAESKQKGKFAIINALAIPEQIKDSISKISSSEIREAQLQDDDIGVVMKMVEEREYPDATVKRSLKKKQRTLLNQWSKLKINDEGILERNTKYRKQIVIPEKYRKTIYEELHEKLGHLSAERVIQLAQERFYWPHLGDDIEHYVRRVCQCLKSRKPNREQRAPLVNIKTSEPFEIVSIDYVHLDKSKGGFEYLLVVVDHFTRYVQVYPTRNKGGRTAADKIFNDYFLRFGFAKKLHHDQGGEFENNLFKRLHELCGVEASRTTPYHPSGNGQVERMNRTIINMLKTLPEKFKSNWKDHVQKLAFAYNCTKNDATSFSPFYLLFGRSPRLPIDLMFNIDPESEDLKHDEYSEKWKAAMEEAYLIARNNAKKNAAQGKKNYDQKIFGANLSVGDRVLVRNLSERGGTGKMRSHWEQDVHVIVSKMNDDLPVYAVRPEKGGGRERVLHRNLLFPCDHLPLEVDVTKENQIPKTSKKKVKAVPKKKINFQKENEVVDVEDSSSEEEEEEWLQKCNYIIDNAERLAEDLGDENEITIDELIESELEGSGVEDDNEVDFYRCEENVLSTIEEGEENESILDETLEYQEVDEHWDPEHVEDSSSESEEEELVSRREGSRRNRKAPRILTYDKKGDPSYKN